MNTQSLYKNRYYCTHDAKYIPKELIVTHKNGQERCPHCRRLLRRKPTTKRNTTIFSGEEEER
jgi:hypothetical protein